jgi:hypothetical protein
VTSVLLRAAILATFALVATGCGGGEAEEDDPKAEYVAETDAICERLSEDSVALVDETLGERNVTPKRLRVVSRESAVIQRQALADLRALPPPPGDEELVERIWDALERAIDEISALSVDDPGEPGGPADVALNEFGALATDYGLGACAQGILPEE